mgnify:CR=1 FL=1
MMDSKIRDITMACLQRSTLTYPVDHTVLESRVMRRFRLVNKGGNPEYLNHKKYGLIANEVGENPSNGKGMFPNA